MKLRRIFTIVLTALLLIGSFFLPDAVAAITDSGRLNSIDMIDSQSVSFDRTPDMSLVERIVLIANYKTEILPINSGYLMDEDIAGSAAVREFARLLGNASFAFDFKSCEVKDSSASFVINTENPNINMIIWELTLADARDNVATVTLDDEMGKIIKVIYTQGSKNETLINPGSKDGNGAVPSDSFNSVALTLTELMTAYYGKSVILGDFYFRSNMAYYRADLLSGLDAIPMFGVVRPLGFTMNERTKPPVLQ